MTEKKRLTKKEKVIATVVSTAIATIPFFVGWPAYEVAANGSEPPMPTTIPTLDLVQDLVIPQNGSSSIINLRQLYDLSRHSTFSVTNGTTPFASIDSNFLEIGFLKVNGGVTGKASFTVTIEDDGVISEESFNVTVVPAESTGKINIGNLVTYMNGHLEDFTTPTQVKQLLTGISPSVIDENTGEGTTNLLKKPFPDFTLNKNSDFSINNVIDLYEYFKQRNVEDGLTFYVFSSNPEIVDINNDVDWYVSTSDQAGGADITVVAVNHSGDMGYDTFHATVLAENQAPVSSKSVYNKYHISPGGTYELDLNQYFTDSLGEHLNFEVIGASGSTISGSKLYLTSEVTDMVVVKAIDTANHVVSQQFTVTGSTYNPFNTQHIFDGSTLKINLEEAFETTAPLNYTFDFNNEYQNNSVTVTNAVYNAQKYLQISGKNGFGYPSSASNLYININGVNPNANEVFTDSLFMTHSQFSGSFDISSLFPNDNVSNIQVSSSNADMTISIENGTICTINGSGTTTITVDVDHGKKILSLPYTTPPIIP